MKLNCFSHKRSITLAVIFLLASAWLVPHHEMWRDELQAWLLARDSLSVTVLFENLKYEGHPGLWHLLLMPLTRIFESPVSMQYLNLAIATASVYVLASYSPFTWPQKAMIAFGYYFFYEYGIIARNYAIAALLVFAYCAIFPYRKKNPFAIAITLMFLSHTTVLGLILALVFFAGLIVEGFFDRIGARTAPDLKCRDWLAILIVLFGFVSAVVQMKPPVDSGFATAWTLHYDIGMLLKSWQALIDAYFPVPKLEQHFWGKGLFLDNSYLELLMRILSLGVFFVFTRSLINRPSAAFVYVCATIGLIAFFYMKYMGAWRHHGFLFVALIAALWIAPSCKECISILPGHKLPSLSKTAMNRFFSFILFFHVVGAAIAAYQDYKYPFSQAKDAAIFIREHGLDKLEIIGDGSPQASAVAGYLNPSLFYYPDAARYGSFVRWDTKRSLDAKAELIIKATEVAMSNPEGGVLVLNYVLDSDCSANIKISQIYTTESASVGDEKFYIYKFERCK